MSITRMRLGSTFQYAWEVNLDLGVLGMAGEG